MKSLPGVAVKTSNTSTPWVHRQFRRLYAYRILDFCRAVSASIQFMQTSAPLGHWTPSNLRSILTWRKNDLSSRGLKTLLFKWGFTSMTAVSPSSNIVKHWWPISVEVRIDNGFPSIGSRFVLDGALKRG